MTFVLINAILLAGQLTAAITVITVAPMIKTFIPDADHQWWPWAMLMVIATALALNVIRHATDRRAL